MLAQPQLAIECISFFSETPLTLNIYLSIVVYISLDIVELNVEFLCYNKFVLIVFCYVIVLYKFKRNKDFYFYTLYLRWGSLCL